MTATITDRRHAGGRLPRGYRGQRREVVRARRGGGHDPRGRELAAAAAGDALGPLLGEARHGGQAGGQGGQQQPLLAQLHRQLGLGPLHVRGPSLLRGHLLPLQQRVRFSL